MKTAKKWRYAEVLPGLAISTSQTLGGGALTGRLDAANAMYYSFKLPVKSLLMLLMPVLNLK